MGRNFPGVLTARAALAMAGLAAGLAAPAPAAAATADPIVHHALHVRLDPDGHRLRVHDRLVIPAALSAAPLEFILNDALAARAASPGPGIRVTQRHAVAADVGMDRSDDAADAAVRVNVYRVTGAVAGRALTIDLDYEGLIDYPIQELGQQYSRGFSQSPGLIEERGVYLAGSTHWVPEIGHSRITYSLETDLPAGWKSVSQGVRGPAAPPPRDAGRVRDTWQVDTPAEQVHLIAARFTEYERDAGAVKAYAFLRTADPGLAARYLDETGRYLAMYDAALGPYPYGKFALVENFWETGYGMPSFTLLGEQIIRFPFILHSSYPHELLHNWWGNGVFVDFAGGNWCEGLTAYLADHLTAEQHGQGDAHRRDILERVTDYVTPQNDFPLRRFRARTDAATEAIGYGKAAMVWNMLRERVGDAAFLASLRRFYHDNAFASAGFDDIRRAFEATTGQDLGPFFRQWVDGTGVPELAVTAAARDGKHVSLTLAQVQAGARVALDVPVALQTSQGTVLRRVALPDDAAAVTVGFDLDAPATRVDVDPQFQVFRRLSPLETPPSLSKAFGAGQVLIVVPAGGREGIYSGLIKAWTRAGVRVAEDSEIAALPGDRPVWVIGATNRFVPDVAAALRHYGARLDADALQVAAATFPVAAKSIVATVRNAGNPATVLVFLSAPSAAAADGLARKLPHYGKYSWLVFGGTAPDNEAKGEWPADESPLAHVFEPGTAAQPLPARPALATLPPVFDAARLRADVDWLAAPEREGRGIGSKGIEAAAMYIAAALHAAGIEPLDGASYFEDFTLPGPDGKAAGTHNVLGVLRGGNAAYAGQALVISAHYDHLGFGWPDAHAGDAGRLHPGADDNASGVAVLLELARALAGSHPERSIIFAAFSGEEEGLVGSRAFVQRLRAPAAPYPLAGILADLNIDTVGRLEHGTMSVLGADSAREWPFIFGGITATTGIAATVVTRAVNASDHTAFVDAGVPAVQFFASTAQDYHRPTDTPDKIDVAGLATVATVLKEAADYLASRPDALHFTGNAAANPLGTRPAEPAGERVRRASTGIVPDMTYEGEGVRAASIVPGSGAANAGLQAGDRLLSIAGVPTPDLKALAEALKTLHPGQVVEIAFARDTGTRTATLTLGER